MGQKWGYTCKARKITFIIDFYTDILIFLVENEFSINKNAIRGGKCDNCEDTLTPGGKNYDANISLEKLRFSLFFKYFFNSLV